MGKDWPKRLIAAHTKCTDLKSQFPQVHSDPNIITISNYLKTKDTIYYEDVNKVFKDLLQTSEGTKDFFGRFKSAMAKEWQMLEKIYM